MGVGGKGAKALLCSASSHGATYTSMPATMIRYTGLSFFASLRSRIPTHSRIRLLDQERLLLLCLLQHSFQSFTQFVARQSFRAV